MMAEFSLQSCVLDLPVLRFDQPRAARRVLDVTRGRAGRPTAFLPCLEVSSSTWKGEKGLISFNAGGGVGTLTLAVQTSRRTDGSCTADAKGLLGASVNTRMGDPRCFSGEMVERMTRRGYGDALDDVRDRTR